MSKENIQIIENSQTHYHIENNSDIAELVRILIAKWHFFAITIILGFILAFIYVKSSVPIFKTYATLLIYEEKQGIPFDNNNLLSGFDINFGNQNFDNQIEILTSRSLIGRALDELDLYSEYYYKKYLRKVPLYPYAPLQLQIKPKDIIPSDVIITVSNQKNNSFNLKMEPNEFLDLNISTKYGDTINIPKGFLIVEILDTLMLTKYRDEIEFVHHSRRKLIEYYKDRIRIERLSKTGTIISLSLEGPNSRKDIDFLNKLIEIFLKSSLEKKNEVAIKTIQFIDEQLIGISDSLIITENKLQQFRSKNRVMNLSAQGQVIIDQAVNLENEKARLGIEANYYNYLSDYLSKGIIGQAPIAPATLGITDPGLTRLVTDLADLQAQLYSKSLGEKNPLQTQLIQRVKNVKNALQETLNGVKRSNALSMNEITEQIRSINAQASTLPITERQLLGIERKYKLNDELYTFLLEKRAEAQIQKASNLPDNEIIDYSDIQAFPVKPKASITYILAFLLGVFLPFLWIIIADKLNNKIIYEKDINSLAILPISGMIPFNYNKDNGINFEQPGSITGEAFRLLRSKMQFFTKNIPNPVVLITSSMQGEGKTNTAINLGLAYSLIGKKTVILDFDLRKPSISTNFNLRNEVGISTWLISNDDIDSIIFETKYKNLFVIPSGTIPPNPSELAALDKTRELFQVLKNRFDYIIVDSSPIGIVTDAYYLSSFTDAVLLIARQRYTPKDILSLTIKEIVSRELKSVSILFNGIKGEFKKYKYQR